MTDHRLTALSPLDGRYADKCADLASLFSEAALIGYRVRVEVCWLRQLANSGHFPALGSLPAPLASRLDSLAEVVGESAVRRVKEIERETNHDVKAVEYFLREQLAAAGALPVQLEFVHFACTSEDINNLSYAMMLADARGSVMLPLIGEVADKLARLAHEHAATSMLSRTHGQPASPTTLGKEAANFVMRLRRAAASLGRVELMGKFNGAVGNFNAQLAAGPQIDWRAESRRFILALGLVPNEYTTQIEPHDWIAEYCDALARADTVLIDLCRDLWGYVSLGYFRQRPVPGEVGSSTMPHKVNPIDFENAEGNAGLANAMLRHFAEKLPVSRWQRDLSDSTVMRNLGVALGHSALAWRSALRGLERIEADGARMTVDLDAHWEVLAEAIQTVMRAHGIAGAYEKLKEFTRGREIGVLELRAFVAQLGLPDEARRRLESLTPTAYTGLAEALARAVCARPAVLADTIECVLTTWSTDRPVLQKIRREVFIDEQLVPEFDEWDDDDTVSVHALATLNREPVGTGRLNPGGKIGRIAVKAGLRGQGIGTLILRHLLHEAYHRGIREPYLHAQIQVVPFYEKLGFRIEGDVFDEAGIFHVRMKHALE